MGDPQRPRLRPYATGLVALGELGQLAWEHLHGGVVSHHILHRADMPAISNWWGLLVLPALTWFLAGRIQRRGTDTRVIAGFAGSMLFGILLSVAFINHYDALASYMSGGMLVLALLLPVYRAECVLGFVLAMTFTFGAVLPTIAGSILAALSAFIHLVVLRFFRKKPVADEP